MNSKNFVFTILLVLPFFNGYGQEWLWAYQSGGSGVDHGQQIALANDGSIYHTGTFTGIAVFGADTLESNGFKDIFLSKFTAEGQLEWTKSFGSRFMDFSYDVEPGLEGGVIITGSFADSMMLGETVLYSEDAHDTFLAKFSREGDVQWAHSFGGKGFDASFDLESDKSGNFFLLRTIDDNPLDSLAENPKAYNRIELSKFNLEGEMAWSYKTSGRGRVLGNGLAIDHTNNLYLTGEYNGEVAYRGDTLNERYGIYVLKLSEVGELVWQRTIGADHIRSFGSDLVVDVEGNVFLTGGFDGIGKFGPDIMSSMGNLDIFVACLKAENGSTKWIERAGGIKADKGMGICLAEEGFFITGWYEAIAYFGYDTTVVANGGNDFFIAKYNKDGTLDWIDAPISKGLGYGKAIKGDGKGNFVCTGWFTGLINFPTDLFLGTTRPDIFIAKFREEKEEQQQKEE
ncbi:MAG: hypothetical protein AAF502_13275 [Bacteroidota bacterium]